MGFFFAMNFLGHLFFSSNDPELMVANLFGDHFHGKQYTHFSSVIQKGILLHRKIDDFIDHHSAVKELRLTLYSELPKVAGIAIDLYFDHLLAERWSTYHNLPLNAFLDRFYGFESHCLVEYPPQFQAFIVQLKTNKWMNHYGTEFGLRKSCEGVSQRLSFSNKLIEAPSVYISNQEKITSVFELFMKDAIAHFNAY